MKRLAVVMFLCMLLGFIAGAWADHWAISLTASQEAASAKNGEKATPETKKENEQ